MKNMLIRQGTVPAHSLYATAECLQIKDVNPSGLSTDYCGVESWLPGMCKYAEPVSPEKELYFYHPDHLGSSSWITGSDGQPTQYLAYLPFGEEFIDQQTSNWSAAYKFTGKEKDVETGYNYFHARYYSSDVSIFLNVDLLSDEQPWISSYAYCNNNPVKYIDPDGNFPWLIVWAAVEIGLAIYDAYETKQTIADPNASIGEKIAAGGGFLLGALLPGGGYGKVSKEGVKYANKLISSGVVTTGKQIKNVKGFANTEKLTDHFTRHGKQFGAKTKEEYLAKSQNFFKKKGDDIVQYTRKDGDIVKYDTKENIFGIIDKDGNIKTMFKPKESNYFQNQATKDLDIK